MFVGIYTVYVVVLTIRFCFQQPSSSSYIVKLIFRYLFFFSPPSLTFSKLLLLCLTYGAQLVNDVHISSSSLLID
jgi:hypothetical protein